jgi:hypothetical protein
MSTRPADADVRLSQGVQRQGDVLITPLPRRASAVLEQSQATVPIPADGIPVVQGEATANTHLLVGYGTWSPATTEPDLGIVHVATAAYLLHPEHTALGIGAGRYRLRRQRERTPIGTRMLAD